MRSGFTFDEMKIKLREDFLELISSTGVENRLVRIWEKEQRMIVTEEQIDDMYLSAPHVYSIQITATIPKGASMPHYSICLGRDGKFVNTSKLRTFNSMSGIVYLGIPEKTSDQLKAWGERSAKMIAEKLFEEKHYYLREVQFDLISDSEKKAEFILLNLPIENIRFSTKPRNQSRVSLNAYVNENIQEYEEFLKSPYVQWMQKQKDNSDN